MINRFGNVHDVLWNMYSLYFRPPSSLHEQLYTPDASNGSSRPKHLHVEILPSFNLLTSIEFDFSFQYAR